jgi:archaellum biogenesis protein FlaJ (TadC family)
MENLKKKRKLLSAIVILIIGVIIFQMRTALDQMPIPLFLMIFAAGIATGGLIVISRMIHNERKPLEKTGTE